MSFFEGLASTLLRRYTVRPEDANLRYVWNKAFVSFAHARPARFRDSRPHPFPAHDYGPLLEAVDRPVLAYVVAEQVSAFVQTVLPRIRRPFVLVTGCSDLGVPGGCPAEAKALLDDSRLLRWFAQDLDAAHPKMVPIPIGVDYHTLSMCLWHPWGRRRSPEEQERELQELVDLARPVAGRLPLAVMNFSMEPESRARIWRMLGPRGDAVVALAPQSRRAVWEAYLRHAFVLCPRGYGQDSHRTWEALILGCIPIVQRSPIDPLFENLPVVIVDDWEEVTRGNLDRWLVQVRDRGFDRHKLENRYWHRLFRDSCPAATMTPPGIDPAIQGIGNRPPDP